MRWRVHRGTSARSTWRGRLEHGSVPESLVVAAPAHVSVHDTARRLFLGRGQRLRVEAVLEDRLDGSVAARTGVERPSTCSLDACVAILLGKPKETQAAAMWRSIGRTAGSGRVVNDTRLPVLSSSAERRSSGAVERPELDAVVFGAALELTVERREPLPSHLASARPPNLNLVPRRELLGSVAISWARERKPFAM
jgi:hypothetical protein